MYIPYSTPSLPLPLLLVLAFAIFYVSDFALCVDRQQSLRRAIIGTSLISAVILAVALIKNFILTHTLL